jgi:hypothetical protein
MKNDQLDLSLQEKFLQNINEYLDKDIEKRQLIEKEIENLYIFIYEERS